jgi:probable F420-dependent oxidoreductase
MAGLWVPDHLVFPGAFPADYPYTDSGRFDGGGRLACLESVTTLAWLAHLAPTVRLGVSVLILPQRNPVAVTKAIATLDVLSAGRAVFGAGVGWLREEFDALGADFDDRGAYMDEYLAVYQALCRDQRPAFAGRHYQLPEVVFEPKPVQRPWPPIHIGGNSPAALRRAARVGDAWQPVGLSPEAVGDARERLDRECVAASRDPGEVGLSLRCFFHITGSVFDVAVARSGNPGQLIGEPGAIAEQLQGYSEAGVDELLFSPLLHHDASLYVEQVERFVHEVTQVLA